MTTDAAAAASSSRELESQPILDGTMAGSCSADFGGNGGSGGSHHTAEHQGLLHRRISRWQAFTSDPLVRAAAVNMALILTWYSFSTLLSLFNKLVLGQEHGLMGMGAFPAPFLMSSVQFFFQHLIARAVLLSGMAKRKSEGNQSWGEYFKKVVPNGIATGLDIGFSNYSLVFITLSFYVMCKSTTPLFLLVFAIAWGIEKPSWSLAAVVSVISAGLLLLVYGETQFHLVGFLLVMTAAMLAGLRWTITQVLLQGHGHGGHGSRKHGGPVEVLYQLTPVMGLTLLLLSLVHERLWHTLPTSPYFETLGLTLLSLGIMFGGALIAFCMVVAEFALIANTSALTFMVAGTFKEIVTVAAAVMFLGEHFTWVNGMGLLVLIAGVVLFNWIKYQKLKSGVVQPLPISNEPKLSDHGESGNGGAAGGGDSGGSLARSSSGSEVELGRAVPGGGHSLGHGHGGGSSSAPHSPSGGGGHDGERQVLMLGTRHAFLLEEDELTPRSLLRQARGPGSVRSRTPSPGPLLVRQESV